MGIAMHEVQVTVPRDSFRLPCAPQPHAVVHPFRYFSPYPKAEKKYLALEQGEHSILCTVRGTVKGGMVKEAPSQT